MIQHSNIELLTLYLIHHLTLSISMSNDKYVQYIFGIHITFNPFICSYKLNLLIITWQILYFKFFFKFFFYFLHFVFRLLSASFLPLFTLFYCIFALNRCKLVASFKYFDVHVFFCKLFTCFLYFYYY